MINRTIYAIATEKDECHCTEDEWFDSFEDAMASRMNYSNWFAPKGDVWIRKHDGSPACSEEWHIDESGKIISHYDWDEVRRRNKQK